jgi:hypothetical protein
LLINFGVPSDEINTSYGVDNEILLHVEVLIGSSFIDTEFNASFSQGIISDLYLGPETGGIAAHSTALISSSGTMIPNGGIRDDSGSFFIGSFLVTASPVPVPGAGWLFGSALIGLVGLKRQK